MDSSRIQDYATWEDIGMELWKQADSSYKIAGEDLWAMPPRATKICTHSFHLQGLTVVKQNFPSSFIVSL